MLKGIVGWSLGHNRWSRKFTQYHFIVNQFSYTRRYSDDKEYVFPYTRKSGTVKGHYRNLHAPRPNARKVKADPRIKQLDKLIQRRANSNANDVQGNLELSAQIRELLKELNDFTSDTLVCVLKRDDCMSDATLDYHIATDAVKEAVRLEVTTLRGPG